MTLHDMLSKLPRQEIKRLVSIAFGRELHTPEEHTVELIKKFKIGVYWDESGVEVMADERYTYTDPEDKTTKIIPWRFHESDLSSAVMYTVAWIGYNIENKIYG